SIAVMKGVPLASAGDWFWTRMRGRVSARAFVGSSWLIGVAVRAASVQLPAVSQTSVREIPARCPVPEVQLTGELAGEGVPVHYIRRQLGHNSLAVTARYIEHLNPAEVVAAIRSRPSPVAPSLGQLEKARICRAFRADFPQLTQEFHAPPARARAGGLRRAWVNWTI